MGLPTKDTSLLPARFPPRPDELFTSWLTRLAWVHGLKVTTFCNLIAGEMVETNRDLDGATHGGSLLASVAIRAGLPPEQLRMENTLAGFDGRLYPQARSDTATTWVLPLGPTTRRRPFIQFCPICLSNHPPYFRRTWRLSLFAVCPSHGCLLHHQCPQCGSGINPLKEDGRRVSSPLAYCWCCEHDLRSVPLQNVPWPEAKFAYDCEHALLEGILPAGCPSGIGMDSYFSALAIVCARLISKRPRLRLWRELAAKGASVELPPPVERHSTTAFDTIADPKLRSPVLGTASWLLQEWPERFLEVARRAGTRTSDFTGVFYNPPAWFLEPLRTRLTPVHHAPPPTVGIVRAAAKRELVLARRDQWSVNRQGRIVRALRAAGFYAPATGDDIILRWLRPAIASLRAKGRHFRLDATCRVVRGTPQWRRLRRLARPYRKDRCSTPEQIQQGIHLLCQDTFLSAHDLGELMERCREVLKAKHLTPMVRAGRLETAYGENVTGRRNHPKQAYRSVQQSPLLYEREELQKAFLELHRPSPVSEVASAQDRTLGRRALVACDGG